jgi:hypothetical protein
VGAPLKAAQRGGKQLFGLEWGELTREQDALRGICVNASTCG